MTPNTQYLTYKLSSAITVLLLDINFRFIDFRERQRMGNTDVREKHQSVVTELGDKDNF